ncbi:MAG TPA: hypothetical protein VHI52_04935, partial [Verrucomicrobiae bacterium]|nr:hypothetical protein [Verrucomicrobiae bacterium]
EGERHTYRSNAELRKAVEAGKAFWDFNNEIAPAEVKQITVTEIRLVYCTAKSGRSEPVLCLDAEMKKDDGMDYGVLFLPLQ